MKREEIEQAIKNGESVWYIINNELAEIDLSCNFHEIKDNELLTWYDKYSKDYYTHRKKLEDLYKSQAEAEHYLNHANVERVEQLPFLTWEEFLKEKYIWFVDKEQNQCCLYYITKFILINKSGELIEKGELTEANFYKAYDECVRLFKQGE